MQHIKKFNELNINNTDKPIKKDLGYDPLLTTTANMLTNYYSCDECNALWRNFNSLNTTCPYCGSIEIEDISEDEWYELVKKRLNNDEIKELEADRKKQSETFVDLTKLKRNPSKYDS